MKRCYNFSEDQARAIDDLARKLQIKKTDVLMNGLRLFRLAVHEARQGNRIAVVRDNLPNRELVGPWSEVGASA